LVIAPFCDNSLWTFLWRGQENPSLDREATAKPQDGIVCDANVRAGVDFLKPSRVLSADRTGYQFFFESRPAWIRVSMDEANNVRTVCGQLATDHETNRLARGDTETVRIAYDFHCFVTFENSFARQQKALL
jgi:hypothetical protein